MSLRWKITLSVALLAAIATISIGALSYRATRDRLYGEIDQSLVDAAEDLVSFGPGHDWRPPRDPLEFFAAQQLDLDGNVVQGSLRGWRPDPPSVDNVLGERGKLDFQSVSIDGESFRVATIGIDSGAIQIARPQEEADRVLRSLRNRTVVLVVAVTAAAALLGSLIATRVTVTLRRLTAAADTVRTTGRLDVTVPREDGSDEVSRLGSAFGSMLESLDRSRAEQQRLVQDAGHELRTPLTSLRTNLDVIRRHPDLPGDQRRQIVDDVHAEIEEMVNLVDEIVTVAAGVATDEPVTEFSLGDVVRDVAARFERRTGRSFAVAADESPVRAQHTAIERAVSNLLDNAAKFDPGGHVEVRVAGGVVDVLDHGPGIPDADLPYVFERFHRAASAQSMPGSGLGLSIVHDVVVRNGGAVRAGNREGGGAIVSFRLPVIRPQS
jgi:two-component system, OmpR family, sensor histidine kinase MprB